MSAGDSVTLWIERLQAGDAEAAQPLFDRYYLGLVRLARARLGGFPRRAVDEEDVALSAFDSFCRGAEQGRFPQLRDRDNLWRLLVVITARKVLDARRHETREKRGGGAVRGESAWLEPGGPDEGGGIAQVIGKEPTPAFAAEVADQMRRWLESLGSDELRAVAVLKMEGYSSRDIALKLDCVERSVERRLKIIRNSLEQEAQPCPTPNSIR